MAHFQRLIWSYFLPNATHCKEQIPKIRNKYSQKWNWNLYISTVDLPILLQEISGYRSWKYINHSQTHKCGNRDWGRAIPRKGIHKCDFRCSDLQMKPYEYESPCCLVWVLGAYPKGQKIIGNYCVSHRLKMKLDLQSLFGLHVHSCTHWLRPHNTPPPHLDSYTRALLVSQDRWHLLVFG